MTSTISCRARALKRSASVLGPRSPPAPVRASRQVPQSLAEPGPAGLAGQQDVVPASRQMGDERARAWIVLPAPSGPSSVMNQPRRVGAVGMRHGRSVADAHGPTRMRRIRSRDAATTPPLLGSAAHARPDRPRPRHGHRPGRRLCRRPRRPPPRGEHRRSRPAASKASPRARARASASASSSTAPGASRASHILTDRRGRPRRRRGRPDRPGVGDRPARAGRASTTARRPAARYETPVERGPVQRPARAQDRRPARGRPGGRAGSRASPSPSRCTPPSASGRRSPPPTAASPSRSSPTSAPRSRPTPSTATSTSGAATRTRAAAGTRPATSTSASLDLADAGRAARRGGRRAADAPRSARRAGSRSSSTRSQLYLQVHESCGHPTELDRVFGTEASYAGHELPDDRQARRRVPLRLGPHRHRRRRDRARRHGHVRLGRRGRRGPGRAARPGRASSSATSRAARPRRGSAGRAAARCAPTAGTGSRSSG